MTTETNRHIPLTISESKSSSLTPKWSNISCKLIRQAPIILAISGLLMATALLVGVVDTPSGRQMHTVMEPLVAAAPPDGAIWGNRRSKIYHWPGCMNYPSPPRGAHWVRLPSPDDAPRGGFRPAKNCPAFPVAPLVDAVLPEPLAPGAVPPAP